MLAILLILMVIALVLPPTNPGRLYLNIAMIVVLILFILGIGGAIWPLHVG
jgi:hypothetical protein